jgi:hypothetical protein
VSTAVAIIVFAIFGAASVMVRVGVFKAAAEALAELRKAAAELPKSHRRNKPGQN